VIHPFPHLTQQDSHANSAKKKREPRPEKGFKKCIKLGSSSNDGNQTGPQFAMPQIVVKLADDGTIFAGQTMKPTCC